MKILNKIFGMALLVFAITLVVPKPSVAQDYDDEITFQTFYDELEPYGTWLYDPKYGDVWVPDVDPDFRPYATNGHWVVTSYGNTWVSDYDWGWATFHYGRWIFDDFYGWEWVPGYEWGPAWVSWREGGGYYGWAPMQPGITVDIAFGANYWVPDNYWVFAPQAYIGYPNIYNYYVPRTRVVTIIRNTNWIRNDYRYNNRRYIIGPRPRDIERVTRNRVTVYNIGNAGRPGRVDIRNNTVNIYRPNVRQVNNVRPTRVVDARAYREANPNNRLVGRGSSRNNDNRNSEAARTNRRQFADFARNATADNKYVRFNRPEQPRTDRQPTPVSRPGQPELRNDQFPGRDAQRDIDRQNTRDQVERMRRRGQEGATPEQRQQWEQQRQQREQQRQQMTPEQQEQRRQQMEQQRQQMQQQTPEQREQQRQQWEQRRQQRDQQRQQMTPEQQEQRRQQFEQQRQQREQQRQQQDVQRQQQQAQQSQQQDVQRRQRDQADQQQREQQRQQWEQQRVQREQQRQQADQQRVQQEQQRQQQEQAEQRRRQDDQQREQQRQQMQQQREQQRQQMEQQRQQQQEQQRQQQEQQRQQRDQQAQQQREQQRQQMEQQRQQQEQQRQQQRQQQDDQRRQRPPRP